VSECRTCGRPIEFRATDDRVVPVEPEPVVVSLGPPRELVAVVLEGGRLCQALLDAPGEQVEAWVHHNWFRCRP
jgi:Alkylmercury lyase